MNPSGTSTMQEVCAQLKCGRKRLYALIRDEGFPAFARIGRENFFYDDAITAWRRTRPDLFPPACYADSHPLNGTDDLTPSMRAMLKQVEAEKHAQAIEDRKREAAEKVKADELAREEEEAKARRQRVLYLALAPKEEAALATTSAASDRRKSALNQRKVRATLRANRIKLKKPK